MSAEDMLASLFHSAIFLCVFFSYLCSVQHSQLEGFGFDPQAILGGVSVLSLCLCRLALGTLAYAHGSKTRTVGGLSTLHSM